MGADDARPSIMKRIVAAVRQLKLQIGTLWHASADARTPTCAKLLAALVLGMALSPIDLIPDFIPVLGMIDDIILVPLGVWLTMKLIPDDVWHAARLQAEADGKRRLKPCYWAAAVIGLFWAVVLARCGGVIWRSWAVKQQAT